MSRLDVRILVALLAALGMALVVAPVAVAQGDLAAATFAPPGDAARGRLVFGQCRTCHYADTAMGHNNGPNLHRIFGKVAGKQPGFEYYSEGFKRAEFVWTPQLLFAWLEAPMKMFPGSSMMSLGVPEPQQRADLIAFLKLVSVRSTADEEPVETGL